MSTSDELTIFHLPINRIQTLELENRKAVTGGGKRSGTDPSSADGSAGAGANDSADSAQVGVYFNITN